jgi:F-type H+-transporting ATPase subunit b
MPQLDPIFYASQVFWLAITFILLYQILARFTLPHISKVLQSRQDRIANDLDKAEQMQKEAEKVAQEYETAMSETKTKAHGIIASASEKVAKDAQNKREELDAILQKKVVDADKQLRKAQQSTLEELKPAAADIAASIVKDIAKIKVSKKNAEDAVAALLKE